MDSGPDEGRAERAVVERYFGAINARYVGAIVADLGKTDGFGTTFEPPAWRRELVELEPLPKP